MNPNPQIKQTPELLLSVEKLEVYYFEILKSTFRSQISSSMYVIKTNT